MLTLNRGVSFQRIEDFQHVGSHHIKRIIIEPDLEALSPFLLLTQAYQVATQQRMTLPVFRISLNAGARVMHCLLEPIIISEAVCDMPQKFGVAGAECFNPLLIAGKIVHALFQCRRGR